MENKNLELLKNPLTIVQTIGYILSSFSVICFAVLKYESFNFYGYDLRISILLLSIITGLIFFVYGICSLVMFFIPNKNPALKVGCVMYMIGTIIITIWTLVICTLLMGIVFMFLAGLVFILLFGGAKFIAMIGAWVAVCFIFVPVTVSSSAVYIYKFTNAIYVFRGKEGINKIVKRITDAIMAFLSILSAIILIILIITLVCGNSGIISLFIAPLLIPFIADSVLFLRLAIRKNKSITNF